MLKIHPRRKVNRMSEADQREAELYELKGRLVNAERKLEYLGYRHCDIAACNCNSYHRWQDPPEVHHLRTRLKEAEALLARAHPGMHTCETGQWFTDRDAFLKEVTK